MKILSQAIANLKIQIINVFKDEWMENKFSTSWEIKQIFCWKTKEKLLRFAQRGCQKILRAFESFPTIFFFFANLLLTTEQLNIFVSLIFCFDFGKFSVHKEFWPQNSEKRNHTSFGIVFFGVEFYDTLWFWFIFLDFLYLLSEFFVVLAVRLKKCRNYCLVEVLWG